MKKKYLSMTALLCACLITACSTGDNTGNTSDKTQQDIASENSNKTEDDNNTETDSKTEIDNNTEIESKTEESSLTSDKKNDASALNSSDDTSDATSESMSQENSAAQSVQPDSTPEDYYSVSTSLSSQEVEDFASNVRAQILAKDWEGLSEELSYPITIDGNTCADSAAFLALDIDSRINPDFLDAIEAETCRQMFCNYEGISMGNAGQVWIGEISGSSELKITAINGMLL